MQPQVATGSKFSIQLAYDEESDDNGINGDEGHYNLDVQWLKKEATIDLNASVLECLTRRLFLHHGHGGCLMPDTTVMGFTEFKLSGVIYRCHPSYRSGKPWMDWAMVSSETHDDPVPVKLLMFLDLRKSTIMSRIQHRRFVNEKDPTLPMEEWSDSSLSSSDNESDDNGMQGDDREPYLKQSLWCVIHRAKAPVIYDNVLSTYHLHSRIGCHIELEKNLRLLPLTCIEGPCFVGENKGQFAYIIDDKSMWSDKTFMTT